MGRGVLLPHARRLTLFLRPMGLSTSASVASTREPLHVCVVGSGPAGFYTAEKMLKGHEGVQVDIIDRLPTPFGLVRSGVAPDHPETKIVVNQFSRVAANARCSFFGNVTLGSDVSLSELRKTYDVVVLAYGAESDRSFGIPGEDLRGIHSAREFVWWYNGHPDMCNLAPDLKNTDSAVVLGQGNVALDVGRILLRCTTELSSTDIAGYALDALRSSTIRKVFLVGRRGPVQAACTAKELREILGLKNVHVCIKEADLVTSPADQVCAVNCGSSCTLLMPGLPSTAFFLNITSPVSGNWQIRGQNVFLFTGSSCPAGAVFLLDCVYSAQVCLFFMLKCSINMLIYGKALSPELWHHKA